MTNSRVMSNFRNSAVDKNGVPLIDYRTPPDQRLGAIVLDSFEKAVNRYGVQQLDYETMVGVIGSQSGWVRYKCYCDRLFWKRVTLSQVRGCGQCGATGRGVKNDITGLKSGRVEVVGHEKGKGWVCKCVCGREKTVLSATLLTSGAVKSCGLCRNETPDQWPSANDAIKAQSSGLRPPDFAISKGIGKGLPDFAINNPDKYSESERELLMAIIKTKEDPSAGDWHMRVCKSPSHPIDDRTAAYHAVWYVERTGEDRDCPLCLALAKVELLEG